MLLVVCLCAQSRPVVVNVDGRGEFDVQAISGQLLPFPCLLPIPVPQYHPSLLLGVYVFNVPSRVRSVVPSPGLPFDLCVEI